MRQKKASKALLVEWGAAIAQSSGAKFEEEWHLQELCAPAVKQGRTDEGEAEVSDVADEEDQ